MRHIHIHIQHETEDSHVVKERCPSLHHISRLDHIHFSSQRTCIQGIHPALVRLLELGAATAHLLSRADIAAKQGPTHRVQRPLAVG